MTGKRRTVRVDTMARVEGEGGLQIDVDEQGHVTDVRLDIFEPPRFFEALLRGRSFTEPPDITARICGICPVAYQMSACLAIEDALGAVLPDELVTLRRLLYCGEWVESHALHIHLLHAPDFLGYPSALEMAADHRDVVERGLRLKRAGNDLMAVVGGRSVHPVNVRVGGFHRLPTRAELRALVPDLQRARDEALATVEWVGRLDAPDFDQTQTYVALRADDGYPLEQGRVVTSDGQAMSVESFGERAIETHVPHSNALHAHLDGTVPYVVGPLARYSLNHDRLSPIAQQAAAAAGLGTSCRNPFRSIVVRAVELLYAVDEALRIIDGWEGCDVAAVEVAPVEGAGTSTGHGATEAPRGILYHRYGIGDDGLVTDAVIVPPTSQNLASIEQDLARFVSDRLELPHDELTWQCEQAVRNYDPCISCATHFLDLTVRRA